MLALLLQVLLPPPDQVLPPPMSCGPVTGLEVGTAVEAGRSCSKELLWSVEAAPGGAGVGSAPLCAALRLTGRAAAAADGSGTQTLAAAEDAAALPGDVLFSASRSVLWHGLHSFSVKMEKMAGEMAIARGVLVQIFLVVFLRRIEIFDR